MKKFFKIILLVVIIIMLIFSIYLLRNYIIIKYLHKKWSNTYNNNNYHILKKTSQGNEYIVSDMYKIGEKEKLINHLIKLENFDIIENITIFSNKVTTYWNFGDTKNITENSSIPELKIPNPYELYTRENNNILIELIKTNIKTTSYNDKEYYIISNTMQSNMYIDKENGLLKKAVNGAVTLENGEKQPIEENYYYEFNTVKLENVEEPNADDYK